MSKRVALDVDGVVLDLMGGFKRYLREVYGLELDLAKVTNHNMERSPLLAEFMTINKVKDKFVEFMKVPRVYQDWVTPVQGAIAGVNQLIDMELDVVFVTATMKEAPTSFASKFDELRSYFPNTRVCSIPSELKCSFKTHFAVDDRWDTCDAWRNEGAIALCYGQTWSGNPLGNNTFDWDSLVPFIRSYTPVRKAKYSGEF